MSTDIYFILDESGSMTGRDQEVISAVNEYINDRRKDDAYLSIVAFDSTRFDWIYQWWPTSSARRLATKDYKPHGSTPLNDSVAKVIRLAQQNSDTGKLIIVYTDGYENSSQEFPGVGNVALKALIDSLDNKKWGIVYLGEAGNTQQQAVATGISVGNIAKVANAAQASHMANVATRSYYSSTSRGATLDRLLDDEKS